MGARARVAACLLALVAVVAQAQTFPSRGVLTMATIVQVTGGTTPLYLAPGAAVDQTEAFVSTAWKSPGTIANLECRASTPFTGVIVVTGRTGACNAPLVDAGFTCTLTGNGSGIAACDTGAALLEIAADTCWSFKLTFPNGPLSAAQHVRCTMVKAL